MQPRFFALCLALALLWTGLATHDAVRASGWRALEQVQRVASAAEADQRDGTVTAAQAETAADLQDETTGPATLPAFERATTGPRAAAPAPLPAAEPDPLRRPPRTAPVTA